jgi:hypothetical protein
MQGEKKKYTVPQQLRQLPEWGRGYLADNLGWDYSDDEEEFIMAVDRYKRDHRRPYPDARDILAIVAALGYRKMEGATHGTPVTA